MNVLFVCLGNICRSPLAQGIFERELIKRKLDGRISVDSCGTAAFSIGKHPDPRAIAAGSRAGIDISAQVARMIGPFDFERFDFILPMDNINLLNVQGLRPDHFDGELRLLASYSRRGGDLQIADPYHKNTERFDALIPELKTAVCGLLDYILEHK